MLLSARCSYIRNAYGLNSKLLNDPLVDGAHTCSGVHQTDAWHWGRDCRPNPLELCGKSARNFYLNGNDGAGKLQATRKQLRLSRAWRVRDVGAVIIDWHRGDRATSPGS